MVTRAAQAVAARKREDRAYELRQSGKIFREIGQELGVHAVYARLLYLKAAERKSRPIEITDEMIAAGVAAFHQADMRVGDEENLVYAIYEAMFLARPNADE